MTFRYVPVFSMKDANLQPPLPKIQLQAISQELINFASEIKCLH